MIILPRGAPERRTLMQDDRREGPRLLNPRVFLLLLIVALFSLVTACGLPKAAHTTAQPLGQPLSPGSRLRVVISGASSTQLTVDEARRFRNMLLSRIQRHGGLT